MQSLPAPDLQFQLFFPQEAISWSEVLHYQMSWSCIMINGDLRCTCGTHMEGSESTTPDRNLHWTSVRQSNICSTHVLGSTSTINS
ncbi:hypothetical protein HAX54_035847 [Datura stramonium]|uniref:Uncharacterized protein n=1 Tax=Datura stramonium TaxID=4076 RepID=A0ABS8VJ65_DATST|nr:hypothetical protein [Datura stramonium]